MPWNNWRGGIERGRIARTQLAVDLDQRVVRGLIASFLMVASISRCRLRPAPGRTLRTLSMPASISLPIMAVVSSLLASTIHFAGRHVDHVGGHVGAFEVVRRDLDLRDLGLDDLLHQRRRDLLALRDDGVSALGADRMGQFHPEQAVGDLPEELLVLDDDLVDAIEGFRISRRSPDLMRAKIRIRRIYVSGRYGRRADS